MALTSTQSGLQALAGAMPVRNRLISDQQKAARALQIQQTIAGLSPQQAPTATQAAQMGATAAQAAGQQKVSQAEQMIQQAGQIGQLGMTEQRLAGAQRMGELQQGARQEQLDQTARLASLDDRAKKELFDAELQIKKDAANNVFFSERQLADYLRNNAVKEEQFKSWAQKAQQVSQRNIQALEMVYAKLDQAEKMNYARGKQKADQALAKELADMKAAAAEKIQKAKNKAANTAATWGAVGDMLQAGGTATMFFNPVVGAGLLAAGSATKAYGNIEAGRQQGRA